MSVELIIGAVGTLLTLFFGGLWHRAKLKASHTEGYAKAQGEQATKARATAGAIAQQAEELRIEEADIEHTAEATHEAIDAAATQARSRPITTASVQRSKERLEKLQAEERRRRG